MTRNLDHISERDLERLSAYLDGELSEHERERLEARLKEEGRLQGALEELQGPIGIMRQLPQVRPPRNYTLTPQVVGQREAGWRFPALRFATAVAALLLVAVVGLDAVTPSAGVVPGAPVQGVVEPLAALEAQQEEAPVEEEAAEAPQAMEAERQAEGDTAEEGTAASEAATPAPTAREEIAQQAPPDSAGSAAAGEDAERTEESFSLDALSRPGTLRAVELALAALVVLFGYLTYRARPTRT